MKTKNCKKRGKEDFKKLKKHNPFYSDSLKYFFIFLSKLRSFNNSFCDHRKKWGYLSLGNEFYIEDFLIKLLNWPSSINQSVYNFQVGAYETIC